MTRTVNVNEHTTYTNLLHILIAPHRNDLTYLLTYLNVIIQTAAYCSTRCFCCCLRSYAVVHIGVASYGALGHVPPLDFQLVILGITRFTDSYESCARVSVQ